MATVGKNLKLAWLKGMEALGTSASNLASNARLKVQEMNLETRRREVFSELANAALELWQKGESLPAPLDALLKELSEVDEKLGALREQRRASADAKRRADPVQPKEAQPEEMVEAAAAPEAPSGPENIEAPEGGEQENQKECLDDPVDG